MTGNVRDIGVTYLTFSNMLDIPLSYVTVPIKSIYTTQSNFYGIYQDLPGNAKEILVYGNVLY